MEGGGRWLKDVQVADGLCWTQPCLISATFRGKVLSLFNERGPEMKERVGLPEAAGWEWPQAPAPSGEAGKEQANLTGVRWRRVQGGRVH